MPIRLFIDGAAGTTGLEIRERLQGRDEFELLVLDDAQRKDEAARRDALHAADIAILCLPDDAAKDAVKLAEGSGTRIIDASSAHRVADGWTYGFPELIGQDKIANAQFVSNPGCYPTGFLALVAPLVRAGLLPADWPCTVNAVSGYSGGGNALIDRFERDTDIAFRAYGLRMGHKHLAEMQVYAGLAYPPVFSPAVVPAFRGMIVDVPLPLAAANGAMITFANGGFDEELLRKDAAIEDTMALYCYANADNTQVRLIAHLDNLGKGASGAAIQNLNIMCGLPETTGLRL
ncbi:MAG: N-acetyl-gamma-glutamyl-phosphate reductase [Rhizobiaceae bacterium]|nr:N-acetyl-gamma-glutamyl-phosphate reductase [Rhizobiaceae bacterium]